MIATNARSVECSQEKNLTSAVTENQPTLDLGIDLSTWSFLQGLCGLFDFPDNPDSSFKSEPLWNSQDQQQLDAVQVRIDEVLRELELYISRTKPQALNQSCPITPEMRKSLTVSTLDSLIRAYFDYATLHTPIIGRSCFNIHTTSSHLLLAIIATGGQLLPSVDSTFSSSEFFELVQDFIFDQAPLRNPHSCGLSKSPLSHETLEILQAALIMLCTEVATRSNPISHSTCISRFLKLVSAIRGFSLTKVRRYDSFTGDEYDFDSSINISSTWKRFLKDEAMIRVAWMAFLLDIQFVLFFRTPPRFTITEMTGDLPCPDELFTNTPDRSQMEIPSRSTHECPALSLSSLINLLMQPSSSDSSHFSSLNARGLFGGICGLHSIIFSAQTTHSIPYMRQVLERALDRWRILWDELQSRSDEAQLEMLGFMKHALEFWVLAKTLLRADPSVLKIENVDMPSKGHLYNIYKEIGNIPLA
ncbi:uncharacterized protein N7511_005464 [Penicillium nucicola]|uniref:uncharacterized protein n=1 Tax=Penicillium nucicola TaxID=1850975 RepID=UPI0025452B85|nr:uncharacterized protein N7511_005464 [Penicillium nucicola]KAJ5762082.1 hypothetical protein N7511_005464 [Penicillium nucicola]